MTSSTSGPSSHPAQIVPMAPIGDLSLSMEEEWNQQTQRHDCCDNTNSPITTTPRGISSSSSSNRNSSSRYDYRRDDSAVRDVVCASTALMGENVLDSPGNSNCNSHHQQQQPSSTSSRLFQLRDRSALGTPQSVRQNASSASQQLPAPPLLHQDHTTSEDSFAAANVGAEGPNTRTTSTDHGAAMSVGIMAQGLAWARRQRERRKQQYLQWQTEQQLRIIAQAQEQQQQQPPQHYQQQQQQQQHYYNNDKEPRSLLDNSIFQNLAAGATTTTSRSSSGEMGESVLVDTHSRISKKVSKSGDGYSVELPGVVIDSNNNNHNGYNSSNNNDEQQHQHYFKDEDDASWVPPVRVDAEPPDTLASCPFILSASEMQQIAVRVLPRGISSYCQWKRYYSLARDGDAFDNCLRNVRHMKPTLLVVRTTKNAVLGGLADEPWEPQGAGGACFYGGSAAGLFKIVPTTPTSDDNNNDNTVVQYFPWSGANRYVQLCDVSNKMLAFGGGGTDGAFGLCVEQDFQVGSTGPCATFDNDPLCDQENFDICDMEIYGFLLGQF